MLKKRWAFYLFAVLLVTLAGGAVVADLWCYEYQNSRLTYFPGYGFVCSYTGGTCLQCFEGDENGPFHDTP